MTNQTGAPAARTTPAGAVLRVRVVPRAGHSTVAGVRGDAVLVRLASAPVEGRANDALIDLLAERLRVPRHAVLLVAGHRSRDKRLEISGLSGEEVLKRLSLA